MLAIRRSAKQPGKCHPNLLPCKINHNGSVDASDRHWKPSDKDSHKTAYFRGRKLHGRAIKLPSGYRGSVLRVTDNTSTTTNSINRRAEGPDVDEDEEMEDDEEQGEEKLAEELSSFDEFTVWGHEATPAAVEDPYAMAVEEWIGLAEAIHSSSYSEDGANKASK